MHKTLDPSVAQITYNVIATLRDKDGNIKKVQKVHNIIPTVGRAAIANFLTDSTPSPATSYVNYGAVGTGTNVPANGDTTLQTETARTVIASSINSNNIAYITAFFAAGTGTGTLKEAGLFIAGTGSANSGTLLSRVAINIVKTGTDTLTLDWTITIS